MMLEEDGDDAGIAPEPLSSLSFSGASFFSIRRTFTKNENCNNFLAFVFYIFSITRLI